MSDLSRTLFKRCLSNCVMDSAELYLLQPDFMTVALSEGHGGVKQLGCKLLYFFYVSSDPVCIECKLGRRGYVVTVPHEWLSRCLRQITGL